MSELKPCPFCGGEAKLYSAFKKKKAFVLCKSCEASSPMRTEAEAIEAWNRRANDA